MHGHYSQPVMWENVCLEYQTGMKLIVLPQTHMIHNTPVLAVVVFLCEMCLIHSSDIVNCSVTCLMNSSDGGETSFNTCSTAGR